MKGLLLKDLYLLRTYCRMILLMDLIFLFVYALGDSSVAFYLVFPCLLTGVLPVTLYAYDEREKWNVYAQTLPVTKAQYVTEKYLLSPLLLLPITVLAALALMIKSSGDTSAGFALLLVSLSLGLLTAALVLPFSLRFGVEKGRLTYYAVLGVIALAVALLASHDTAPSIAGPLASAGKAAPLLAAAIYVISWRISIRLYEQREL